MNYGNGRAPKMTRESRICGGGAGATPPQGSGGGESRALLYELLKFTRLRILPVPTNRVAAVAHIRSLIALVF